MKNKLNDTETRMFSVSELFKGMIGESRSAEHEYKLIRRGKGNSPSNGTYIPDEVIYRALTAGSLSGGGYLVGSKTDLEQIINDKTTLFGKVGVEVVESESGMDMVFPTIGTQAVPVWHIENIALAEDDPEFGNIQAALRTLGASVDISRLLLMQTKEQGYGIILDILDTAIQNKVEIELFNGSGTEGEVMGLESLSTVNQIDAVAGLSLDMILSAVENSETNSIRNNFNWVCSPATKKILANTPLVSGGENMLLKDGKIQNYPVYPSPGIADGNLHLGDFSNVMHIKYYGGAEVRIDRGNQKGALPNVLMFRSFDLIIRNAASFNRIINIS